jgi:hypothetical protein
VVCRDRGLREWQFYEWKKGLRPTEVAPFIAVIRWHRHGEAEACAARTPTS